jgi:hypothetical protein
MISPHHEDTKNTEIVTFVILRVFVKAAREVRS